MILNLSDQAAADRLEQARRQIPAAARFLEDIEHQADPFALRLASSGIEFEARSPVDGRPNRAVLKVFCVEDGPLSGRTAVFFFKRSQMPWSRDRHSYGACLIPTAGPAPGEVEEWLTFASTGFDPRVRPSRLRQAFSFTVPD